MPLGRQSVAASQTANCRYGCRRVIDTVAAHPVYNLIREKNKRRAKVIDELVDEIELLGLTRYRDELRDGDKPWTGRTMADTFAAKVYEEKCADRRLARSAEMPRALGVVILPPTFTTDADWEKSCIEAQSRPTLPSIVSGSVETVVDDDETG